VSSPAEAAPRHILVLCHEDPTSSSSSPAATGLRAHIDHWVTHGHRVTVITGSTAHGGGGEAVGSLLTVHRLRPGATLPFRSAWAVFRGLASDADVVLEVVGRRAFLTPLWTWLSQPRAALVTESAGRGLGRVLFDGFGVQHLYRGTPQLHGEADSAGGAASLQALREAAQEGHRPLIAVVRESEMFKAVGLAAATLAGNAISLLFTIVFTRILGPSGYGSLASLVSVFLILSIGGSALQVAAARETALGRLGSGDEIAQTLSGWLWRLGLAGLVLTAGALLLREPISHVVTVPDHPWAAAATIPTACLWVALSLQRGVLQGLHAYGTVGVSIVIEAGGRLAGGLALVAAGGHVTGAYLGTPVALLITMLVLAQVLRRRLGAPHGHHEMRRLRTLFAASRAPVAALMLFAVLQNVDVIIAHDRIGGDRAGSYAAAAVAAKLMVWIGIGIGLYLLPEATRRKAAGQDTREVLVRGLGVLALVAAPALLIFAAVPHLLLKVAFGPEFTQADDALLVLGVAMTLLTMTYLSVQYLLALGRKRFLWVLVVVAAAEPILLMARDYSLLGFATAVLVVQALAAVAVLAMGLGWRVQATRG
jgi:O-antigen/teichoic acid export membrane protein